MAIDKERDAKILRYHLVEHWGVHTIATQLGIHHSTVDRVLSQAGMPKAERARQASIIDPYVNDRPNGATHDRHNGTTF